MARIERNGNELIVLVNLENGKEKICKYQFRQCNSKGVFLVMIPNEKAKMYLNDISKFDHEVISILGSFSNNTHTDYDSFQEIYFPDVSLYGFTDGTHRFCMLVARNSDYIPVIISGGENPELFHSIYGCNEFPYLSLE